jgi:transposase
MAAEFHITHVRDGRLWAFWAAVIVDGVVYMRLKGAYRERR